LEASSKAEWCLNQSLSYELLGVMPAATDPSLGLFQSALATIQQRTNVVSLTGQPDLSDWVNTALVDIPCMFAIQRPSIPNQSATSRQPQQIDTETEYHCLLNGYYPEILQSNQLVITILGISTAYEIMAVESDSQQTQTRMAARIYTQ
jgi:hypothetical protein